MESVHRASNEKGAVYQQAHEKATPQSNIVKLRMYDSDGNVTTKASEAVTGYWYVNDLFYKEIIIQRYPNEQ